MRAPLDSIDVIIQPKDPDLNLVLLPQRRKFKTVSFFTESGHELLAYLPFCEGKMSGSRAFNGKRDFQYTFDIPFLVATVVQGRQLGRLVAKSSLLPLDAVGQWPALKGKVGVGP